MIRIFLLFPILIVLSCSGTKSNAEEIVADKVLHPQNSASPQNHFVIPKVPEQITFAGENIHLKDLDLKERMDYELIVNNFWHSNTIMALKRANRWLPMMKEILRKENMPVDLIYIAIIESNLTNAVSPAGAKGFWQFMEATGAEYELEINKEVDERYHVQKSTEAACKYLRKAYDKFGSWTLAAAAYNRGMNGIVRDMEEQMVDSFFDLSLNNETARYVFRLFAVKLIFENPEKYGFYLEEEDLYPPYLTKDIVVEVSIPNIYQWSIDQGVAIKIVRKLNPWIIGKELKVKEGGQYIIKLPKNNKQLGLINRY